MDKTTRREGRFCELKLLAHANDAFLLGAALVVNFFLVERLGDIRPAAGLGEIQCVDPEPGSGG